MFCYQCEQTAGGKGCTKIGVCGKDDVTAALQDLLEYATRGIAQYAHRSRQLGVTDPAADHFIIDALFTTVTNVNFDPARLETLLAEAARVMAQSKRLYEQTAAKAGRPIEALDGAAAWKPAADRAGLLAQAAEVGIDADKRTYGEDIAGLRGLLDYGLKGMAAYAHHARILGQEDPAVYSFFHEALSFLAGRTEVVGDLLAFCLRCGEVNLRVMELLDTANTGAYGHPEPTAVRVTPLKGKAILVSGHDLKDLEELLKQTVGRGINIYTHGEMLPALAYPGLKKYPHLAGHYGSAWQNQHAEFDAFPGSILMTTNCLQKPKPSYQDRLFTCGLVAWPGVVHIADRNFQAVIDAALAAPGFTSEPPAKTITVGFGRNAVLSVADKIIAAVKSGAIKHFFLVGGCDGAKPGRNYYTEFAQSVPADSVILTLACGKFRFNTLEFGDIGGIPRLLDIGQCNDAYSAIQIAKALANAFDTDVNSLPLSFILSWYEQKAVCILLTLLHLGIKNIKLGPSLPAFVTPPVLDVLVQNFGIALIGNAADDLRHALAK